MHKQNTISEEFPTMANSLKNGQRQHWHDYYEGGRERITTNHGVSLLWSVGYNLRRFNSRNFFGTDWEVTIDFSCEITFTIWEDIIDWGDSCVRSVPSFNCLEAISTDSEWVDGALSHIMLHERQSSRSTIWYNMNNNLGWIACALKRSSLIHYSLSNTL